MALLQKWVKLGPSEESCRVNFGGFIYIYICKFQLGLLCLHFESSVQKVCLDFVPWIYELFQSFVWQIGLKFIWSLCSCLLPSSDLRRLAQLLRAWCLECQGCGFCPCMGHSFKSWTQWSCRSLPSQNILWFYSVKKLDCSLISSIYLLTAESS